MLQGNKYDVLPVAQSDTIAKEIMKLMVTQEVLTQRLASKDALLKTVSSEYISLINTFGKYQTYADSIIMAQDKIIENKDEQILIQAATITQLERALVATRTRSKLRQALEYGWGPFKVKYVLTAAAGYYGVRIGEKVVDILRN